MDKQTVCSPLLSLIVLVNEKDEELPCLLRHIQSQSLKNIEVIVVDDSPSRKKRYKDVVASYASHDMSVKLVENAKPLLAKDAWLAGVKIAKGKVIGFIDCGDSFADTDTLEYHTQLLLDSNADIVHFAAHQVADTKAAPELHAPSRPFVGKLHGYKPFGQFVRKRTRIAELWGKLYSARLWKKVLPHARKGKNIHFLADVYLSSLLFFNAQTYIGSSRVGYVRVAREEQEFTLSGSLATIMFTLSYLVPHFYQTQNRTRLVKLYENVLKQQYNQLHEEFFSYFNVPQREFINNWMWSGVFRQTVQVIDVDRRRCLLRVCFLGPKVFQNTFYFDNKASVPVFAKSLPFPSLESDFSHLHFVWIPFEKNAAQFSVQLRGCDQYILQGKSGFYFFPMKRLFMPGSKRTLAKKFLVFLATSRFMKNKYKDSWILADRDIKADDNAEHMCRWLLHNKPEQKVFFAIAKESPDWGRLKAEGFPLVNMRSMHYFFAWVNCSAIVAANFTGYLQKPHWRKQYADLFTHQFCFLQHGITVSYKPPMHRFNLDMLTAAVKREYDAFLHNKAQPYLFTEREVALTGFPRHDALLQKSREVGTPKTILIMPTWRRSIVGELIPGTGEYPYSPTFVQSEFFKQWQSVLSSEQLLATAKEYGYSIQFIAHPYIRQQLSDFDLSGVTVEKDTDKSIQESLANTALLITDYSSIALEVALLKRPVLFFQFDKASFFSAEHTSVKGYFDHENEGLGEVVYTAEDLCRKAIELMQSGCALKEECNEKIEAFYTYADGKCCERVYEAVCARMKPVQVDAQMPKKKRSLETSVLTFVPGYHPFKYRKDTVYCLQADEHRNLIGVIAITQDKIPAHSFLVNKKFCLPMFYRRFRLEAEPGQHYYFHVFWVPYENTQQAFEVLYNNRPAQIVHNGKALATFRVNAFLSPRKAPARNFLRKLLATYASSSFIRKKYAACWLFMDQEMRAGGNAEHLYRWMQANHPEQTIFFAVDKNSPDWTRLEAEGFSLVDVHSLEFFFVWVNCAWLVVSQLDRFSMRQGWRAYYCDMVRHQICYVKHSIELGYQTELHSSVIDMLVVPNKREFDYFTSTVEVAGLQSKREVELAGLPRLDALHEKVKTADAPKTVLIMPSWRGYNLGKRIAGSSQHSYWSQFRNTEFCRQWQQVLASETLIAAAAEKGYSVKFYPHPHIRPQMDDFSLGQVELVPEYADVVDLIADTALLITDYSTAGFDVAMLARPVVYFQFDQSRFYAATNMDKGYFAYDRDAVGDIVTTVDELCTLAGSYIASGCKIKPEYQAQARQFFSFTDGQNCRRIYEGIMRRSKPTR